MAETGPRCCEGGAEKFTTTKVHGQRESCAFESGGGGSFLGLNVAVVLSPSAEGSKGKNPRALLVFLCLPWL